MNKTYIFPAFLILLFLTACNEKQSRNTQLFCKDWKFNPGDVDNAQDTIFDDSRWRILNLPHDWSIEGNFSNEHPATTGGGALPGGIGWYRKSFTIPETNKQRNVFIDFDGVYMNSEVWINGHPLGKRSFGYISFRYNLTPYLNYGNKENIIAVKVDNSKQPNSRWYSGSGIYRNVWLTVTDKVFVDNWGTYITTPEVDEKNAKIEIATKIKNTNSTKQEITLLTLVFDAKGQKITEISSTETIETGSYAKIHQQLSLQDPILWSVDNPYLYKAVSRVSYNGNIADEYETDFGIRYFNFDSEKGFSLNGKPLKILGVCNHHDLGCLGAAINTRAIERQLEILKKMGCNGIRTSHNPPAPELLELCDKMGFIVMDEIFDMWKKEKSPFDYHLYWDEWHKRDLEDFILRDRNHPSVFMWSIGNEIIEQWDSTGTTIAKELSAIVKSLDATRPITGGFNDPTPGNKIIQSGEIDIIGFNYHDEGFESFPQTFPGKVFIGSETNSSIATRGHYDMPSDSVRVWPVQWDIPVKANPDHTCSSYDNCRVGWGSTHTDTWRRINKYDYLSGMYIWTGFDYLGEPTPYSWPARSSYFGVIDLSGFPKDAYYFYQSQWTEEPMLHIFPHWNWTEGDSVDVWAYTNCDEVELFLNDESLGIKKLNEDTFHLCWRLAFTSGVLKATARKDGKKILTKEIKTAGEPAKIELSADRQTITADGRDLSFITIKILDKDGTVVPNADNLVKFEITGNGFIAGVDNGNPISHESFKADNRKAFNGLCLAVIQSDGNKGTITLKAVSKGLDEAIITVKAE